MKPRRSSPRTTSGLASVVFLVTARALAAPPAEVVVIGPSSASFERRLSAEASAVGLAMVKSDGDDPVRIAREREAVAALRLAGPLRVEMWFTVGTPRPIHEVLTAGSGSSDLFAVRVVEQLRARLVELEVLPAEGAAVDPEGPAASANPSAPALPPSNAAPPAAAGAVARPDQAEPRRAGRFGKRLLWAETGVGATAASGGVPGTVHALVGLRLAPGDWNLAVFGLLPLTESEIAEREGRAEVSVNLLGAHVDYVLTDANASLEGSLGLGGGALIFAMQGEAVSPLSGRHATLTTSAFFLDGGVRYRAADWLGIRGSTLVGFCAPRPVLEFAGRDVAAWGRAFGALTASLEFGAPAGIGGGP